MRLKYDALNRCSQLTTVHELCESIKFCIESLGWVYKIFRGDQNFIFCEKKNWAPPRIL